MKRIKKSNIIFIVILILLILPQTRTPIQVLLHKGIALINPVSAIEKNERVKIDNYNWQLITEEGETINLNQFKGKVILINFWATWCPPCIAEMPSLQKLYDKYEGKVEFLFVTNDPIEKIEAFKAKNNYTFPVYQIDSYPPNQLTTKSIPRTLIINKKGEIVMDKSGAVDWFNSKVQQQIELLLKAPI
ncbi:TlpA family protein disulfide reductase [Winogradskyella jejuensis]|uniref:Thiol-disulfide isomerase or thioredoxin n=1 Tax=Winogradskyella jejuensis TaxID=1089305 RepID=A0A1M5JI66_9FLAO|nr:TlpA disulfide reductase family protein [Winogradskyella jejuensis]SHG39960.1 Thiol-disulfide isomerase or thioredoxin [Winogradskyella jejuensis]